MINSIIETADEHRTNCNKNLEEKENFFNSNINSSELAVGEFKKRKIESVNHLNNLDLNDELDHLELPINLNTDFEIQFYSDKSSKWSHDEKTIKCNSEPDERSFNELEISWLNGNKNKLKMYDYVSDQPILLRNQYMNILGKSIESLKLEISSEKIQKFVNIFV